MAAKLPYMLAQGSVSKILEKIQNARRPERFTQDFLQTKLGHRGGSARAIIPLLKRMGFLGSDGVPTALYDQFRNSETQGFAVADGMKNAFSELFERNEYVYEMSREELTGIVVEVTGSAKGDRTTTAIVGTFMALKEQADFESRIETKSDAVRQQDHELPVSRVEPSDRSMVDSVDLRVGYTINLNLPETNDPEVFNAIFRALKEKFVEELMRQNEAIKLFGLNNLTVESAIRKVERDYGIDLGHKQSESQAVDQMYYPQFSSKLRIEAGRMATNYIIFYCLENSIREIISQRLDEQYGADWWNESVPEIVRKNAEANWKKERASGVTPRSDDLIDFTNFGELGEIIRANWDIFGDMFRDVRAVGRVMATLNSLRAPIAHCKALAEDEELRLALGLRDWFRQME